MKIVDCKQCGYRHVDPMPSEKEIEEYYRNKYYEESLGAQILENRANIPIEEQHLLLKYKERLESLEKYAPSQTILDLGCGSGHFLNYMKENGWKVHPLKEDYSTFREFFSDCARVQERAS